LHASACGDHQKSNATVNPVLGPLIICHLEWPVFTNKIQQGRVTVLCLELRVYCILCVLRRLASSLPNWVMRGHARCHALIV
jgi:hypothetical protein